MYSKNTFTLLLLISSVTTWSFAALGDDTNARRIVTSKAYVDDTKQVKIPATTNTYTYNSTNRPTADGSVVTTGTIDGTVGQRGIATAPTYDANDNLTNDSWLPTMGAVMNAIDSHTPTGTQNTIANYGANGALGSGIATYDGSGTYAPATDAGKIATAAAVETKQDLIPAATSSGAVKIVTYPAYGASDGAIGTLTLDTTSLTASHTVVPSSYLVKSQIDSLLLSKETTDSIIRTDADNAGIRLDWATGSNTGTLNLFRIPGLIESDNRDESAFATEVLTTTPFISSAPTMSTLAYALSGLSDAKQNVLTANISNDQATRIVTYPTYGQSDGAIGSRDIVTTLSPKSGTLDTNGIPTAGAVKTETDSRQSKISATNISYLPRTSPTADGSVVTTTTDVGVTGQRGIATAPVSNGNGGYSNGDWLPTVNAMMNAISSATPTISGTQNTIANYGANGALGSGIATYDGSGTYAPATDAGKIATAAAVETKQDIIPTSLVQIPDYGGEVANQSLVTYDTTNGIVGNEIGIVTQQLMEELNETDIFVFDGSGVDNLVPTVDAVLNAISRGANNALPTGTAGTVVTYNGVNAETGVQEFSERAVYDPANTYNAQTDATKLATAAAVETKQNKIDATSDGTGNTPNYVYDSSTNPSAAGSVVTTTTTAGATGQVGIATAPTRDNNGDLTNENWIPTMGAVESMVTATDVSSNAINGIPLSTGGYFYGTSSTAATETTKVVSIPSIPSTTGTNPPTGIMIIVKPDYTSTAGNSLLQLNNFNAKRMRRNNSNISTSFDNYVWNENYPTVWMYDGTYWEYIGGYDYNSNTTYDIMTVTSGRGGTGTSSNTLSPENLKAIIHGTELSDAAVSPITFTPTNAAIDASTDTIMSALGKLQGQVSNRVSTTQSTGYQVLTTGTNGTVTADYISVPVTTSGTGRPTSTNAPTGTAAIWIE